VDNEFQALKENLEELNVQEHVVMQNEHAPEIERQNRVIKERARGTIQKLPYRKIPKKMRIALIHCVVFWMNNTPKEGQDESPREMITGEQKLDYKIVCKIPFGGYAQVHEDSEVTNTMKQGITGGMNLGHSNMQGGHKFLSLETGEILVRRKWTELPVPNEVISRLDGLSTSPKDDLDRFLNEQEDPNEELEGERIEVVPESEDFSIEPNIMTVNDKDNKIKAERIDDEEEIKEMNTCNERDEGEKVMLQDMEPQVEEELPQYDLEENVTQQHRTQI